MRQEKITLILASLALALLANCGNANMSGAVGPRKEKTDKSGARKASSPAVVTGTYLTCDYSPQDANSPDQDAIGCSVSGQNSATMALTNSNNFEFYRSVNGGSYIKPSLTNSASGWQAVFRHAKSETDKSKYIVSYPSSVGFDEMACEGSQLPCNIELTPRSTPMYLSSTINGIWISDDNIPTTKTLDPSTPMDPTLFCNNAGSVKDGNAVWEEAARKASPIVGGIVTLFTGGSKLKNASRFSIPYGSFCAVKKNNTRSIVTSGNNCNIMVLRNKNNNRLDHRIKNSKVLPMNRATVLVIKDNTMGKSQIESVFENSICP